MAEMGYTIPLSAFQPGFMFFPLQETKGRVVLIFVRLRAARLEFLGDVASAPLDWDSPCSTSTSPFSYLSEGKKGRQTFFSTNDSITDVVLCVNVLWVSSLLSNCQLRHPGSKEIATVIPDSNCFDTR